MYLNLIARSYTRQVYWIFDEIAIL